MKATIRRLHSPDVENLETWVPAEPGCFGFLLQVMVGPSGGQGEESFDFIVCSPEWLRRTYGEDAVIMGRHHVILFDYRFESIKDAIKRVIENISGESWGEVAIKISRYGKWEFEDYRE